MKHVAIGLCSLLSISGATSASSSLTHPTYSSPNQTEGDNTSAAVTPHLAPGVTLREISRL